MVRKKRFILGIEMDGATYHSGFKKEFSDLQRQVILENKGWNIYRIWSKNWIHNIKSEFNKLINRIDSLLDNTAVDDVKNRGKNALDVEDSRSFSTPEYHIEEEQLNSLTYEESEIIEEKSALSNTPLGERLSATSKSKKNLEVAKPLVESTYLDDKNTKLSPGNKERFYELLKDELSYATKIGSFVSMKFSNIPLTDEEKEKRPLQDIYVRSCSFRASEPYIMGSFSREESPYKFNLKSIFEFNRRYTEDDDQITELSDKNDEEKNNGEEQISARELLTDEVFEKKFSEYLKEHIGKKINIKWISHNFFSELELVRYDSEYFYGISKYNSEPSKYKRKYVIDFKS